MLHIRPMCYFACIQNLQKFIRTTSPKFGFLIVDKELSATLPLADLFVCGGSTTVQWAKLCGVPVINMDYLDLDIDLFKEPVGITQVRTPEEFSVALKNWFHNRTSKGNNKLKAHAAKIRQDCRFDGMTSKRFVDFLLQL